MGAEHSFVQNLLKFLFVVNITSTGLMLSKFSPTQNVDLSDVLTLDSLLDEANLNPIQKDETLEEQHTKGFDFARHSSRSKSRNTRYRSWSEMESGNVLDIDWDPRPPKRGSSQKDLVQPDEAHFEGVPVFIQHPKPLYYTMKGHPATVECVAEPVSHAVIECAEKVIPYKGPEDSGRLQVIRLNSENRVDPNGKRWHLVLQVRANEVEEWFDSYVCRCEAWNKVVELQRPKKVVSKEAVIVEAYLDRKFQLEPVSTDLEIGSRLVLICIPPKGKPDPEAYWLKDRKRVTKETFPHIIVNDYNHLLIENATVTDSGNYTCVADLLGIEYRYATASVNVHRKNLKEQQDRRITGQTIQDATELQKLIRTHEVAIYVCLLLFLTLVLGVVALVASRRRKPHCSANPGYCVTCCFGGRGAFASEKNGMVSKDPLLLHDFKISTATIKNPSALDPNHVLYEGITDHLRSRIEETQIGPYHILGEKHQSQIYNMVQGNPFVPNVSLCGPPCAPIMPMNSYASVPVNVTNTGAMNHSTDVMMASLPYFVSNVASDGSIRPTVQGAEFQTNTNQANCDTIISSAAYPAYDASQFSLGNYNGHELPEMVGLVSSYRLPDFSGGHSSTNTTTNTTAVGSGNAESSNCSAIISATCNNNLSNTYVPREKYQDEFESGTNDSHSDRSLSIHHGSQTSVFSADLQELTSVSTNIFNEQGGVLQLPNSGTSLYLPQGSIPPNTEEHIYLGLCQDDRQRPQLSDTQTLLSPIVQFGPAETPLSQAVVLSIPHCAAIDCGQAIIRLLMRDFRRNIVKDLTLDENNSSEYVEAACLQTFPALQGIHFEGGEQLGNEWKEVLTIGIQSSKVITFSADTGVVMHITASVARLITQTPQRYCLVGESLRPHLTKHLGAFSFDSVGQSQDSKYEPAAKLLRLVAFSGRLAPTMDFNVRVYVLPDTLDSLEHVTNMEQQMDGYMVDSSHPFIFRDNGSNLCFTINGLSDGWRSRLHAKTQEIPFRHIWSGTQVSTLHCAFTFEHTDETQTIVSCQILVFQAANWNQRETLHISCDAKKPPKTCFSVKPTNFIPTGVKYTNPHRLSLRTKTKIIGLLEKSAEWQMLAEQLGMENLIPQLNKRSLPVLDILNLWEATNPTKHGITELHKRLLRINRTDCAELLNSVTSTM